MQCVLDSRLGRDHVLSLGKPYALITFKKYLTRCGVMDKSIPLVGEIPVATPICI